MDDKKLGFGKYAFNTPNEIADKDPKYIIWLYEEHSSGKQLVSRSLYTACQMDVNEQEDHTEDCYSVY